MGCSMGAQEYVSTVMSNLETWAGGDPDPVAPDGEFNPLTSLLPVSQFDRIRMTVEVLSGTADVQLYWAAQMSRDGVEFQDIFSPPSPDVVGVGEWLRTAWLDVTAGGGNSDFVRLGLRAFTLETSSPTRQLAVVRMRVEFKMGT